MCLLSFYLLLNNCYHPVSIIYYLSYQLQTCVWKPTGQVKKPDIITGKNHRTSRKIRNIFLIIVMLNFSFFTPALQMQVLTDKNCLLQHYELDLEYFGSYLT